MNPGMTDSRQWYEKAFEELYPLLYAHRDDESAAAEIQAITQLAAIGHGNRVLDICCGAGRHMEALLSLGFDAYGIDLSAHLLGCACVRECLPGRLARADIRYLPFDGMFDAVLNLFTSFGYFDDDGNCKAMKEIVRVAALGGVIAIDHINKSYLQANIVAEDTCIKGKYNVTQRREITDNRVVKEIIVKENGVKVGSYEENVRLYTPDEMNALLHGAGTGEVTFYGGYSGEPMSMASPRMIAIARKEE